MEEKVKPAIVFNAVDSEATGLHRVLNPIQLLKEKGYIVEPLTSNSQIEQIERNDIAFMQCLVGEQQFPLMERLRQDGIKVIIDYDDDFSNLPDKILKKLRLSQEQVTSNWKFYLDSASHITVPTEMLKRRIEELSKTKVTVIPNYICKKDYEDSLSYKNEDLSEIRILYSCSESHYEDFEYISKILDLVGKWYPQVKLISQGGLSLDTFVGDYKYKHQSVEKVPYMSYYKTLRELKPHIFIAPLRVTPHNVCRSNLKYLQAGVMKATFIGENLPPYENVKNNGLTSTTRIGWWWNFRKLIKNPDLITEFGNKAYLDIKNHLLEDHIGEWEAVFNDN